MTGESQLVVTDEPVEFSVEDFEEGNDPSF
jgi:hypothetical protein